MDAVSEHIVNNVEVLTIAAIGLATIVSNFYLQRRNISTAARQRLHEQVMSWTGEIKDKVIALATDYSEQARQIADVGDGVNSKRLQGDALTKAIGNRYDHLQVLLKKSFEIRKEVRVLLGRIDAVPVLSLKINKALKALNKEYHLLDKQMGMDFDRILAIGVSTTPDQKQFEVFAKDIIESQRNLYEFADLIEDLEVLVNNALVKNIYGKRPTRPADSRSKQLTLNGVIDPQL